LNVAEEWFARRYAAGYDDGRVATVAAVMMVRGGGRSGMAREVATDAEMIDGRRFGAQGMRDGFWSTQNVVRGIGMVVGQN
jgi:hypothetical protein